MDDHRWGFEDAEEWEYQEGSSGGEAEAEPSPDAIIGEDPDRVVTVTVTRSAEVVSVSLAAKWRSLVDPRGLHSSVLAAANRATMQALAVQVEEFDMSSAPVPVNTPATGVGGFDESQLTKDDVERLMAAVSTELDRFNSQLSAVVDRPATAESAGGHVAGSSQRGQVLEVAIEPGWASTARNAEIESEVLEVLQVLHRLGVPDELAGGPHGSAISELNALASDPQRLMRRLGFAQ
jgi:hypothetical protein